jgi:glycosyltransferase involved in cell wall biosynthesis
MVESKLPLSVAIITKDEERTLPDCLKSVSFADEIVVVDSGSTDSTTEVAREYGCRVFVEQWKGFGLQKRSAIEKCTHDWILVLDADETIPDEARVEIEKAIKEPKANAYSFPRKNYFRGKLMRHGTWGSDEVVRLFRKGGATISGRLVHEAIEAESTAKIAAPIYHYPDTSANGVRRKMDVYSSAGAEQLFSEGKRSSIFKAVSSGLAAFLKCYFLKLGVLDGKAGFIIAVNDGIYAYYKYSRLLELQERVQR